MEPTTVVCLESSALEHLILKMVEFVKKSNQVKEEEWVDTNTCMKMLNIQSKTTLQKLRDTGQIAFSTTTSRKAILYDRSSIIRFIESNKKEAFFYGK